MIGAGADLAPRRPAGRQARPCSGKRPILEAANALQPAMKARGGGGTTSRMRLIPVRETERRRRSARIVHLLVDTQDAMGANLINTMCEGVAPLSSASAAGGCRCESSPYLARPAARARHLPHPLRRAGGTSVSPGPRWRTASPTRAGSPTQTRTGPARTTRGVMNGVDAVALGHRPTTGARSRPELTPGRRATAATSR